MTDHRSVRVMQLLGAYEHPAMAMFVGGCVRNSLLGEPVTDIDIATIHHPLKVIERLSHDGIRYVPTGLEHGTVTAIIDGMTFEITTLRKDMDTDGRHAVIAFTERWSEDAARRDFTINTLLAAPDGSVFDPLCTAIDDLDSRRVVFVGDAAARIAEDFLRILRFFRFHACYGGETVDADALSACAQGAGDLARLSRERVTQEFLKILAASRAPSTLTLMAAHGILAGLTARFAGRPFEIFCALQGRHDAKDVLARLSFGFMAHPGEDQWLVLSGAQKRVVAQLPGAVEALASPNRKKLRAAIYRHGNEITLQAYLARLSLDGDPFDMEMLDVARYWQAPRFPVSGDDLLARGYERGPALGDMLDTLEKKWIASDFSKVPKY